MLYKIAVYFCAVFNMKYRIPPQEKLFILYATQ